jgi:hypothetical protein
MAKINNTLLEAALEGLELQKQRIEEQIREVRSMMGGGRLRQAAPAAPASPGRQSAAPAKRGRKPLSAAARRRIAAAQKKRWAEYRKSQKSAESK